MEIKYAVPGASGKQCQDCKHYNASPADPSKGDCFGHEVVAQGTCNMFTAK